MITAETIRRCAYLSGAQLETLTSKKHTILNPSFVGITNGREFCYQYQYPDSHSANGLSVDKVFVRVNDNNLVEAVD